jgi:hypothetical protein
MLCSKDMDTSIYGQASSMKADGKAMTPNAIATIALKYMRTYCDSTGLEWRSMTTNTTALKEKTYDVASDQAIKDAMKLVKEAKKQKSEVNKNMSDASRARKSVRRKAQPKKK